MVGQDFMCEGFCALALWVIEVRHVGTVGGAKDRSALANVAPHKCKCTNKSENISHQSTLQMRVTNMQSYKE